MNIDVSIMNKTIVEIRKESDIYVSHCSEIEILKGIGKRNIEEVIQICISSCGEYVLEFHFVDCDNVIDIPKAERDERIGSVFNYLFRTINNTESVADDTVLWDFCDKKFLHPFFLGPLAIYKNYCSKKIIVINVPRQVDNYFNQICFYKLLCIDSGTNIESFLNSYLSKSFIPICCFDMSNSNVDGIQTIIQRVIEKQSNASKKIKTPLSYFLGELICNISQHSKSEKGYIFSQYLAREKCIEICIADRGITIYGSYLSAKKYLKEINDDESIALQKANEGYSTKNLPDAENRGYGISSTKRMLVDGLNGAFFMLSGGAFHRHDKNFNQYIKLPDEISWEGTIILMKIPVEVNADFDYSKYVR